MIKLEVEIKDGKFLYTYEIGSSRHSSSQELCADTLASFTDLLRICSNHYKFKDKEFERELWGKAYLEKMNKSQLAEKK
jgi:hypothetical protein